MFCGFKSRWMIRLECAYCTASQIFRNRRSRAARSNAHASRYSISGAPSTYSITKFGLSPSPALASSRRAIFGCFSRARISFSIKKRRNKLLSPRRGPLRAGGNNLMAAIIVACPSTRSASHTTPMPPVPNGLTNSQGPNLEPADNPDHAASGECENNCSAFSACLTIFSASRIASPSSPSRKASSASRSPTGNSSASASESSMRRQVSLFISHPATVHKATPVRPPSDASLS